MTSITRRKHHEQFACDYDHQPARRTNPTFDSQADYTLFLIKRLALINSRIEEDIACDLVLPVSKKPLSRFRLFGALLRIDATQADALLENNKHWDHIDVSFASNVKSAVWEKNSEQLRYLHVHTPHGQLFDELMNLGKIDQLNEARHKEEEAKRKEAASRKTIEGVVSALIEKTIPVSAYKDVPIMEMHITTKDGLLFTGSRPARIAKTVRVGATISFKANVKASPVADHFYFQRATDIILS